MVNGTPGAQDEHGAADDEAQRLRRVDELKREAQATRDFVARTPKRLNRKGQELKTNITDPDSAKLAPGKGVIQGYAGQAKPEVNWHVAMRPGKGKRRALNKAKAIDNLIDQIERIKASVRAKVEHPFRVIKPQFGHVKVRYRGLKENTAQLTTLFALSNLWMARKKLWVLDGQFRPKAPNAA